MLNFIIMTISFTVALLLASTVSMVVMFKLLNSEKVVKWYFKWFMKYMKNMENLVDEIEEEL